MPAGDSGRGVSLVDFETNLDAMVTAAQAANIRVVLLSPTLVYEELRCEENRRLGDYVRAVERLARRRKVQFVDLNRAFREAVGAYQRNAGKGALLLTTDGVHLNDAGNALVAGTILRALGASVPDVIA